MEKKNSFLGLQNLEAKEIVKNAEVFKFLLKASFHMVYIFWVTTSKDKVITIKETNYEMDYYFLGI